MLFLTSVVAVTEDKDSGFDVLENGSAVVVLSVVKITVSFVPVNCRKEIVIERDKISISY